MRFRAWILFLLPSLGLITPAQLLGVPEHQLPASALRSSEPVVCSSNEDIVIDRRSIDTEGTAVRIDGNCDVIIRDSYIRAGEYGVLLRSNATVYLENSYVEGVAGAMLLTGNGDIHYSGTTVRGRTQVAGNAELMDNGGNVRESHHADPSRHLQPMAPLVCREDEELHLAHRYIETDGDGIRVEGRCAVLITDSYVVAGGKALVASGTGRVRVRNSTLHGASGPLEVLDRADLHIAGSNLLGPRGAARSQNYEDGGGNYLGPTATKLSTARSLPGVSSSTRHGSASTSLPPAEQHRRRAEPADDERRGVEIGAGGVRIRGTSSEIRIGRGGVVVEREGHATEHEHESACAQLCHDWPRVRNRAEGCAIAVLEARGYPVLQTLACESTTTERKCITCLAALELEAADCEAITRRCLD